jgi:hypothetical protein
MIILISLCIPISAQEDFKPLIEFDGTDWMTWPEPFKIMFVEGFGLAHAALQMAIASEKVIQASSEDIQWMIDWLFLSESAMEVVVAVESFYRITGMLDYPIWAVIYICYDKHWWGPKEEEPEPLKLDDFNKPYDPSNPPNIFDYNPGGELRETASW